MPSLPSPPPLVWTQSSDGTELCVRTSSAPVRSPLSIPEHAPYQPTTPIPVPTPPPYQPPTLIRAATNEAPDAALLQPRPHFAFDSRLLSSSYTGSSTATNDQDDNDNDDLATFDVSIWDVIAAPDHDYTSISPALARRLKDFSFAQSKRRTVTGFSRPLGILGIYDYMSGIRRDVAWAEDASYRRTQNLPYLSWRDFEINATVTSGVNPPYFTYSLFAVCFAMMIFEFAINGWVIESFATNPMAGVSAQTLIKCGARVSDLIVNAGQGWRLVTAMLLHGGIIHLVFNMLVLMFVGRGLEKAHGTATAAAIFLLGGFGGNVLSALFLPQFVSVGASGGIFAMLGACLADIVMNWGLVFSSNAILQTQQQKGGNTWILFWLAFDFMFNVIIGFFPFVDNFCHLGGLMFGFLFALGSINTISFAFFDISRSCLERTGSVFVKLWGFLLGLTLLTAATTFLFVDSDGVSSPCHACRYMSCIPMPFWSPSKWWYCDDCSMAYGNALYEEDVGYYSLQLVCPNSAAVVYKMEEPTFDLEVINDGLADYCRAACGDGVYKQLASSEEIAEDFANEGEEALAEEEAEEVAAEETEAVEEAEETDEYEYAEDEYEEDYGANAY